MNKRVYGPVASRRWGLSLGVDLVPHKACTFDCVYCQVGPTTEKTDARTTFFPAGEVVAEVTAALNSGAKPQVITFAGSGEPTLYLGLGAVVEQVKRITDIPLLLITNGSLLHRTEVAAEAALFDMVAPSLDAGDEETFRRINGPLEGLEVADVIDGIVRFSAANEGTLALEVFFVRGVNDSPAALDAIVEAVRRIAPHRVDLNTVVRPTPGRDVQGVTAQFLAQVAQRLPCPARPITRCEAGSDRNSRTGSSELLRTILATLKRRPCTSGDLAASLEAPQQAVEEAMSVLLSRRAVRAENRGPETYFVAL